MWTTKKYISWYSCDSVLCSLILSCNVFTAFSKPLWKMQFDGHSVGMWPKHQCSLLVPVFHGDPCIPRTDLHRTIIWFPIPKWVVILKHLCLHINDHPAKLLGFVIQPNPGTVIYAVKKIMRFYQFGPYLNLCWIIFMLLLLAVPRNAWKDARCFHQDQVLLLLVLA